MKYDNVCVTKIFRDNKYKGKKENENDVIYATFKAKQVLIPKETIFLTYNLIKCLVCL